MKTAQRSRSILFATIMEKANDKESVVCHSLFPWIEKREKGINAYFSLKVEKEEDLGSHTMFICEPTYMTVLAETPSCTYEYYLNMIKPRPQAIGTTRDGRTVWRCIVCGYEWVGEELPDDFICPVCKHPKADFEKIVGWWLSEGGERKKICTIPRTKAK